MIALVALFLSLGLDTLAVSVGLGMRGLPRRRWLRVGLTFAFFEGVMPIIGLLAGQGLSSALGAFSGALAGILLMGVGLLAIREAACAAEDDDDTDDKLVSVEGRQLLMTGLSVSLDELAVGFSLGVLRAPLGLALGYIAVQAFAITFAGLALGRRLGSALGERAELASGIILTLLGLAILVSAATDRHFF